jgi:copper chaperone CopZ
MNGAMEQVVQGPKITCEDGAQTTETALGRLAGVTARRVATPAKEVRVEFDPTRIDEVRSRRALADAGFLAT